MNFCVTILAHQNANIQLSSHSFPRTGVTPRGDSEILAFDVVERQGFQALVVPAKDTLTAFVSDRLLLQRFSTFVYIEFALTALAAKDPAASRELEIAEMPFALHRNTAARSAN